MTTIELALSLNSPMTTTANLFSLVAFSRSSATRSLIILLLCRVYLQLMNRLGCNESDLVILELPPLRAFLTDEKMPAIKRS